VPTWVRCRDRDTGHEYDLAEKDLRVRTGRVEVLAGYPTNSGTTARPRPAKHRTDKSGRPVKAQAVEPADNTRK
jgi:hypothetical protein